MSHYRHTSGFYFYALLDVIYKAKDENEEILKLILVVH